eukprot:gene11217-7789_t
MSLAPPSRGPTQSTNPPSSGGVMDPSADPSSAPAAGGGISHAAAVARDAEDYNRILNTIGKPNYSTIRDLFVKGGSMPSDTVPAIQISFELFETVQNRFAATKQTLERTKAELHTRNQQHTELLLQQRNLKEDYKNMEKRAQDAEESNRELRMHAAKLDGTIEQLRMEAAQMRTEMESVQEKLLVQEDRLHNAQNRVAEALVTISQKEAGITALRRELGKFLRYRNSSHNEEDAEDVLRNIAADVEGRAREVRTKLGVAQLQEALQKVEQENRYILQQHNKYVQHVQTMIAAYETQAMGLEDGFASHKCVDTPYYLSSAFYAEYLHPDKFAAKTAEEEALRSLAEPPTEDPGPNVPHKTFRSLTFEFQRCLDRMKRIDIDPASQLKEELYTCIQAHSHTMDLGAQLVSFLSTWEAEVTHNRLTLHELREEWIKAKVPFFVTKVAQGLAESVTTFSTGLVHLLERENDITQGYRDDDNTQDDTFAHSPDARSPAQRRASAGIVRLSTDHLNDLALRTGSGGVDSPSHRRHTTGRINTSPDTPSRRRSTKGSPVGSGGGTPKGTPRTQTPFGDEREREVRGMGDSRHSNNSSFGVGSAHGREDRSVSALSPVQEENGTQTSRGGFSPDGSHFGTYNDTSTSSYVKPPPICSVCRKAMRPDSAEIIQETDQFKHTLNPEIAEEIRQIVTREEGSLGTRRDEGEADVDAVLGGTAGPGTPPLKHGGSRSTGSSHFTPNRAASSPRHDEDSDSDEDNADDNGEDYVPLLDDNGLPLRRRSSEKAPSYASNSSRGTTVSKGPGSPAAPPISDPRHASLHSIGVGSAVAISEHGSGSPQPPLPLGDASFGSPASASASSFSSDAASMQRQATNAGTSPIPFSPAGSTTSMGVVGSPVVRVIRGDENGALIQHITSSGRSHSLSGASVASSDSVSGRSSYLARPEVRTLIDKYESSMRTKEKELDHLRDVTGRIADVVQTSSPEGTKAQEVIDAIAHLLHDFLHGGRSSSPYLGGTLPPGLAKGSITLPPVNHRGGTPGIEESSPPRATTAHPKGKKQGKPRMTQATVDRLYNQSRRPLKKLPPMGPPRATYMTDDWSSRQGPPMGIGGMRVGIPTGAKPAQPAPRKFQNYMSNEDVQRQHAELMKNARRRQGTGREAGPGITQVQGQPPPAPPPGHGGGSGGRLTQRQGGGSGDASTPHGSLTSPNAGRRADQPFTAFRPSSGGGVDSEGVYVGGGEFINGGYKHDGRRADWLPKGGYGSMGGSGESFLLDNMQRSNSNSDHSIARRVSQTHVNQITLGGFPGDMPSGLHLDESTKLEIGGQYVRINKRASWIQHMLQQQQIRRMSQLQRGKLDSGKLRYDLLTNDGIDAGLGMGGGLMVGGYNPIYHRNPQQQMRMMNRSMPPPANSSLRRWSDTRARPNLIHRNSGLRRSSYLSSHKMRSFQLRGQNSGNGGTGGGLRGMDANFLLDLGLGSRHQGDRIREPLMQGPRRPGSGLRAKRDPYIPRAKQYGDVRYVPVRSIGLGGLPGGPGAMDGGGSFNEKINPFFTVGQHSGGGQGTGAGAAAALGAETSAAAAAGASHDPRVAEVSHAHPHAAPAWQSATPFTPSILDDIQTK